MIEFAGQSFFLRIGSNEKKSTQLLGFIQVGAESLLQSILLVVSDRSISRPEEGGAQLGNGQQQQADDKCSVRSSKDATSLASDDRTTPRTQVAAYKLLNTH